MASKQLLVLCVVGVIVLLGIVDWAAAQTDVPCRMLGGTCTEMCFDGDWSDDENANEQCGDDVDCCIPSTNGNPNPGRGRGRGRRSLFY